MLFLKVLMYERFYKTDEANTVSSYYIEVMSVWEFVICFCLPFCQFEIL